MSELKHQVMLNKDRSWVPCYIKSEADKVLASQKYKRCLAMADKCAKTAEKYFYLICLDGGNNPKYDRFPNKMDFWGRWHNRWLELAKKFKEAYK